MGFPQNIGVSAYWELSKGRIELWHTRNLHMCTEICADPTAEEALEWVISKINGNYGINIFPGKQLTSIEFYYRETQIQTFLKNTLSDAVYALIVWAYENKLLEA